ncbi:N-acetyllactosaminide beta-1,3-N-acetylglucosaminyltransferase 2-like [Microcaecilia unicolor]|uniref:Hexosyltransferase n=1 Tax=Microcaecilia unicolor TaxID=1415580 RepID=A0A6P7WWI7_9AMPH|nr:N-acetyllactosaminide beta-1,3-N-acetylglucosaminyltransferase 2-like [Microcaecilia unicolor]
MLERKQALMICLIIATVFYIVYQKTMNYEIFGLPVPKPHPLAFHRESVDLSDKLFTYQLNLSYFEKEFPALQSYNCTLLIDKKDFCHSANTKPLFILSIKSYPASFNRRAALRKTWAKEKEISRYLMKPLFLIATSPSQKQMNLVADEDKAFKDILLWDFMESHHNLSLKERCFLEWLFDNCQKAEFIFKGDDDGFVNPKALVKHVRNTANASQILHGALQRYSTVMRSGKYRVSNSIFPYQKYPSFLSGGGFIFPGGHIPALYAVSMRLPVFPLDDVYFGFLSLAAGLTFRHDKKFYVFGMEDKTCLYKEALFVHGITTEKLLQVWRDFQEKKC